MFIVNFIKGVACGLFSGLILFGVFMYNTVNDKIQNLFKHI